MGTASTPRPSSTKARCSATAAASGTSCTSAPARASAAAARFGQNVYVGNDVRIGDHVQDPEQRLGLRRGDAGGRGVLRPEHGLHQRLQPARRGGAQGRVPAHAGQARCHARRQLHHRLRHHDRRACLRRRRRGGQPRRARLRADARRAGAPGRLDEPLRRTAGAAAATARARPAARTPATATASSGDRLHCSPRRTPA